MYIFEYNKKERSLKHLIFDLDKYSSFELYQYNKTKIFFNTKRNYINSYEFMIKNNIDCGLSNIKCLENNYAMSKNMNIIDYTLIDIYKYNNYTFMGGSSSFDITDKKFVI